MQAIAGLFLVRAVIRTAAFCSGFRSGLAASHTIVLTFDDTLVLLASILLTATPAGFGSSWERTSPFASPEGSVDLPLRRNAAQIQQHKLSISKPYPVTSIFAPPPERAPQRPSRPSPLAESTFKPALLRPPYDPKTPPVIIGQETSLPPLLPPRMDGHNRKPSWPMSGQEGTRLVSQDILWA